MDRMKHDPSLDGLERQWIAERLETLSVREQTQLAAISITKRILTECTGKTGEELLLAVSRLRTDEIQRGINYLLALPEYEVICPGGTYEQLGEYYLQQEAGLPPDLLPFADLERIGQNYEDEHLGVFIGDCFVILPRDEPRQVYDGTNLDTLPDTDWSLRLKLASPAKPEGVWLRLPDGDMEGSGKLDEIGLALRELGVKTVQECRLLDIRCSLPEIVIDLEEYDDLADLIYDGNNLGYALQERGQGQPHYLEKFRAALEYEHCHDLKLALDIAGNLNCYDFRPASDAEGYGEEVLRKRCESVSRDPILAGLIDLKAYGSAMLEREGYELNAGETTYIRRNGQKFYHEYSEPRPEYDMTMQ